MKPKQDKPVTNIAKGYFITDSTIEITEKNSQIGNNLNN